MRTAILIISTEISRRDAPDDIGPAIAALVEQAGAEVVAMEVVPDDFALVEDRLHHYVDDQCRLILTAGGAEDAPEHITPEATWSVIEREVPGIPEAIRARDRGLLLFRGVAGLAGATLVVNLPGSVDAARRAFGVLGAVLPRG
ncbi:MAG TPA: molybdopterin-binding protein [Solirubrobacteraceae bacterium]|jgi:molybdenum cofactor synthesis domain-containing protein